MSEESGDFIEMNYSTLIAERVREAAAILGALDDPPEINFVNKMPIKAQRELCNLLNGASRTQPYADSKTVLIIEAFVATVGRVKVLGQVSRMPNKGEL